MEQNHTQPQMVTTNGHQLGYYSMQTQPNSTQNTNSTKQNYNNNAIPTRQIYAYVQSNHQSMGDKQWTWQHECPI
jgi:hypothetical protein